MILSVLIPTLPNRAHLLQRVLFLLGEHTEVEILTDNRPVGVSTGRKRNDLIQQASGKYVAFVDDDDYPQPNYLVNMIEAIGNGQPDCVTFEGWYTENQGPKIPFVIKLGEKYEARNGIVYRWPNHLCAIKKEIAQAVKFPDITHGEDYAWSKKIADLKLIKTSVHIPKQLYYYDYRSKK